MFTIYLQQSGLWVEFLPLALKLKWIGQKEADYIKVYSLEEVAKVISYFGDQVQCGPPSNFWKVIGPSGHVLPTWISSTYEVTA
jgi:hypothetical protein